MFHRPRNWKTRTNLWFRVQLCWFLSPETDGDHQLMDSSPIAAGMFNSSASSSSVESRYTAQMEVFANVVMLDMCIAWYPPSKTAVENPSQKRMQQNGKTIQRWLIFLHATCDSRRDPSLVPCGSPHPHLVLWVSPNREDFAHLWGHRSILPIDGKKSKTGLGRCPMAWGFVSHHFQWGHLPTPVFRVNWVLNYSTWTPNFTLPSFHQWRINSIENGYPPVSSNMGNPWLPTYPNERL